jgi:acyl-CoA thioester hydrolase
MKTYNKGIAHPWYCDVLGHMTTRFYVGMFDDAAYHFIYDLFGWTGAQDENGKFALADVRHVIDYQAEVAAGDLLEIRGELKKIGGKSMTVRYEMENLRNNEIACTLEVVCVLFDLQERKAVTIPPDLRAIAEQKLADSAAD